MEAPGPTNRMPKFSKGKRPKFYTQEGMDEAMSMILVLAREFSIMRDRLDTIEKIAEDKGIILGDEIEQYTPDEATAAKRRERRASLLESLYYLSLKQAEEEASGDDSARYFEALEDIARG
ncbi:MAG: hypothetical protein AAGK17_02960 [Pseudomonadota bacterium]